MLNTSSTRIEILIILTRFLFAAILSVYYTATCLSQTTFSDITVSAGTGGPAGKDETGGHGIMFADADKDGLADLYITMIFEKPMTDLFFRNLGNNTFVNEGRSRQIADFDGGSHGACWADLDNDGAYDLVNGTTWDRPDYPNHNNIFRNNGDGTFTEVTPPCMRERREGTRGIICFDADNDGDLDIFCVSGWMGSGDARSERNEIYENKGNLRFAAIKYGPLYECPAGQVASDTDYDGDLDMILVDADDKGHLYYNNGDGTFSFGRSFSEIDGYMAGLADLDNDNDLDLVFAGDERSYLNEGSGIFVNGPSIPVSGINDPRAIAFADIDNDGDMDFAVGVKRSRNRLFRNDYAGKNNWLKVRLVSPSGQAGAFGAKVRIYEAGKGRRISLLGLREARSNYGYLGQDDPVLHFGLGPHKSVSIVIVFLDGSEASATNIPANQTIVVEGSSIKHDKDDFNKGTFH